MASDFKTEFLKVPLLKGEENLEQWDVAFLRAVRMNGLKRFLTEDIPEDAPQEDLDRKDQINSLLYNSTIAIHGLLKLNGWRYRDENPVAMYDLIHKVIPTASEEAALELVKEYHSLTFKSFDSMRAYTDRLVYLKERTTQLGYTSNEATHLAMALNGLEGYKWHESLLTKHRDKTLTWPSLMTELSAHMAKDERARKSTSLAAPTSAGNTNNNKKAKATPKPRYPIHERCGVAHYGGDDHCWLLHPELKEQYLKTKQHMTGTGNPSRSGKRVSFDDDEGYSNKPSRGALTQQTGLMGAAIPKDLTAAAGQFNKDTVVLDSGAAKHTFNDERWFNTMVPLQTPHTFTAANGEDGQATFGGIVDFNVLRHDGTQSNITMKAVYVPDSPCNLVSPGLLAEEGLVVDGFNNCLAYKETKTELAKLTWLGGVATFTVAEGSMPSLVSLMATTTKISYALMHRRLLHASKDVVLKACVDAGIKVDRTEADNFHCEDCHVYKATDEIPKATKTTWAHALEMVAVDVIEHDEGHMGFKYTTHFVDYYSGFHWVRFSKQKKEAFQQIKDFVTKMKTQTGRKVQNIGLDGGGEFGQATRQFIKNPLQEWARKEGIVIRPTTAHSPWFNGKIERAGKVLTERARTALGSKKAPARFWPFAEEAATVVTNLLPTKANPGSQSPHERFAEDLDLDEEAKTPYIRHLRTYLCVAYVYVKPQYRRNRDKMAPRAKKGLMIGYGDAHGKIFWVWLPEEQRIVRASAVKFYEGDLPVKEPDVDVEFEAVFVDPAIDDLALAEGLPLNQPTTEVAPETDKPTDVAKEINEPSIEEATKSPDGEPTEANTTGPMPTPEQTPTTPTQARRIYEAEGTPTPRPKRREEQDPTPMPGGFLSDEDEAEVFEDTREGLSDEDLIELQLEAPLPPRVDVERPSTSTSAQGEQSAPARAATNPPEATEGRPRRGKPKSPGHYKRLHEGKGKGSALIHLTAEPDPGPGPCLTALKAQVILGHSASIPKNYRQAVKRADFEVKWFPAMVAQMDHLEGMKAWVLVDRPEDAQVLPGKWVYTEKGNLAKARWVVCGNFEEDSWSVQDVYAAVASSTSVKVMLVLVATQDMELHQFDFDAAFLNANIPAGAVYYVEQPDGFVKDKTKVCLLGKALYGLRKSPLYWFLALIPVMEELGFRSFNSELCLFKNDVTKALVLLYVDDLLVAGPTTEVVKAVGEDLGKRFKIKQLGEAKTFLGFTIHRDRPNHRIYLSQGTYARKIVAKYGYQDLNPATTPWLPGLVLPTKWEPLDESVRKNYIKQTGALNYYSVGTRPDITYTVSKLSEANSGPSEDHLALMKHLFRYIVGTLDLCLVFGGKLPLTELGLYGYADASFADDLATRCSTGGHVIFLAGGPVTWKSKRQTLVTLSTTEAEFINLTPTGLAIGWINDILTEYGAPQPRPLLMHTDSANARTVVLNPLNAARTRHIDLRYKWVIQEAARGRIQLEHVTTSEMAADGLTKPLQRLKHALFVKLLGMVDYPAITKPGP